MPSIKPAPIQPQTEGAFKKLGVNTSDGISHQELKVLDKNKDNKLSEPELEGVDKQDKAQIEKTFAQGSASTAIALESSSRSSTGATAVKHGAGFVVENAAHIAGHGTKLAGRAVPGLGAAVNGYFAYQNISHAVDASKRGNAGAAILYSLAGSIDGTAAVVNAAGAATGIGTVLSVPANVVLGVVSGGMAIGAAYLDD